MRRETRMVLVLGVLAVLGVSSLALMADRYRRLAEDAGVVPGPASPDGAETGSTPGIVPVEGPLDEVGALAVVDAFVSVRREVKSEIERNLEVARLVLEDGTDRVRSELPAGVVDAYASMSASLRERKLRALREAGLAEEDYERVRRAAFEGRQGGEDEALIRAVESRGAVLDELRLGRFERFDLALGPG